MSATKAWIAGLGALAASALAVIASRPPHSPELPSGEPSGAPPGMGAAPVSADPAPDLPSYVPRAGTRYVYGFERRIAIRGMGGAVPEMKYHGRLFVDVLKATAAGFQALMRSDRREMPEMLAQVSSDGKRVALSSADRSGQGGAMLKDLIALWVFPLEQDTAGTFSAAFRRLDSHPQSPQYAKRKLGYGPSTSGALRPEVLSSHHVLGWDPALRMPARIEGAEATRIGDGKLSFSSLASYSMRLEAQVPLPADLSLTGRLASFRNEESLKLRPDPSARGRGEGAPLDWPALARRVAGVGGLNTSEQLRLFGDLNAALRAHPEVLGELVSMLDASVVRLGPASVLFKLAVGTLATVATAEAQAALVDLYSNSICPTAGKGTILAALTTTQAPLTGATREFLLGLVQGETHPDLADGAAFAVGSALQSAPRDAAAGRAIASIQAAWGDARAEGADPGRSLALLDAMGNSGKPEFAPILSSVIMGGGQGRGESSAIRSKAVYALRFMTDARSLSLLRSGLGDSDPSVRLSAANALQIAPWNPVFVAPLRRCQASDPSEAVRKACDQALGRAPQ